MTATAAMAENVAGLTWTPPAGWASSGSTSMRVATYPVGEGAECVVYFFGAGQGGGIQANVDRWAGQFKGPDGKSPAPKTGKLTVHGLNVTTIETAGEYAGMGGPMAKGNSAPAKDYRLLGAIVEGPGGNIFIKFTGPAKTVAANQANYQQLLNSFAKAK